MPEEPLPPLYKYYGAEGLEATLEHSKIRLSKPIDFNDPFDNCERCIYYFDDGFEEKRKKINEEIGPDHFMLPQNPEALIQECKDADKEAFGGLFAACFTESNDNLLMWSHYADQHKGGVIQFSLQQTNKSPIRKIEYRDNLIGIGLYESYQWIREGNNTGEKYMKAMTLKSPHWKYEDEWRLLLKEDNPEKKYCYVPFSPAEIKGLYLGLRMSEGNKKNLVQIMKEKYPGVPIFQAKYKEREYGLDWERIL